MKRIVNGVTYNTETSTRIARALWEDSNESNVGVLYQTRGGAFFVHKETTKQVWSQRDEQQVERVEDSFEPLSPDGAHKWMMEGEVEIIDKNPFDDPPEAAAEAEPSTTIYMRVPASLKRRVDLAARESKLSGNVWAMRCVERCLEGPKSLKDYPQLAYIWEISATKRTGSDWEIEKYSEALESIAIYAEELASELKVSFDDLGGGYFDETLDELKRQYRPYS